MYYTVRYVHNKRPACDIPCQMMWISCSTGWIICCSLLVRWLSYKIPYVLNMYMYLFVFIDCTKFCLHIYHVHLNIDLAGIFLGYLRKDVVHAVTFMFNRCCRIMYLAYAFWHQWINSYIVYFLMIFLAGTL